MNSAATPKIFPAVSSSPKGKPDDLMRDELKHHEGGMSRYDLVREAADLWLRLQADPELQSEVEEWCARSAEHERAFSAAKESVDRRMLVAGQKESVRVGLGGSWMNK